MSATDPPEALVLTTVVSHAAMIPCAVQLFRRRWIFEFAVMTYALSMSFMYHLTDSLSTRIFLTPLQWHRLDNIGALSSFGIFFVYLSCFKDLTHDMVAKFLTLLLAILSQERDPWNINYTLGPIFLMGTIPLLYHALVLQRWPQYDMKEVAIGFGSLAVAGVFFARGLDDRNDPFRMFHGLWHLIGGFSSFHLWRIVQRPTNSTLVQMLQNVRPLRDETLLPV